MAVSLGSDLSCVADIDPAGAEVIERMLLAQALSRRLTTPRGRLIDDANYGYDLNQWLNADVGPAELAQIQAQSQAECLKDERVQSVTIAVTFLANVLIVSIAIVAALGPFQLVLSIGSVTPQLITVTQ